MAVSGCALLLGMLVWVVVTAIVEGLQLPARRWAWWPHWPVLLVAAAILFLLLQVVGAVALKSGQPARPSKP
jgi:hypothetical protein